MGAFRSRKKLSKRGNARPYCALWMTASIRENAFRDQYRSTVATAPEVTDLEQRGTNNNRSQDGSGKSC
jgi:hypothetical protein